MLNSGRNPHVPVSTLMKQCAESGVNKMQYDAVAGSKVPAVREFVEHMNDVPATAKRALEVAQQRQKAYADLSRTPVSYQVGDKVLLSSRFLSVVHPLQLLPITPWCNSLASEAEASEDFRTSWGRYVTGIQAWPDDSWIGQQVLAGLVSRC